MSSFKQYIQHRVNQFAKATDGLAYLEFAIMLPFMITLFLGSVEMSRYIMVAQKTEKAAITVSDLVAQAKDITTADLDVMVLAVEEVMQPFGFGANGYVIISSVSRVGSGPATVNWQYTGAGTWNQTSQIGTQGNDAILPTGFTLDPNEGIIIAEVFYNYSPMILGETILDDTNALYKIGVFKPRLGELTTLGS